MAIICIARELGANGDEIIKSLADITGYKAIDKEYIEAKMSKMGLSAEVSSKYDEKKPGFFDSLSQNRDDYLHSLKGLLYTDASETDCIVAGRGGLALFSTVPGCLCIKVVAPKPVRIARIQEKLGCDAKQAEVIVTKSDKDRSGFHDYFFSLDWNDSSNYDMTINTGKDSPQHIAELISKMHKNYITEDAKIACKNRITELKLAHSVVSELMYKNHLPINFLEVDVFKDTLELRGVATSQSIIDKAEQIALKACGLSVVKNSIQLIQNFTVMP